MEIVQPEASVVQTGLNLRYVGDFAYAYSGPVGCDDSATSLLSFTSGLGTFVGSFYPMYMTGDLQARNYAWVVKFNDETTIIRVFSQNYGPAPEREITIMIPSFTKVLITAENISGDSETHNMGAKLTGRVYGVK